MNASSWVVRWVSGRTRTLPGTRGRRTLCTRAPFRSPPSSVTKFRRRKINASIGWRLGLAGLPGGACGRVLEDDAELGKARPDAVGKRVLFSLAQLAPDRN